LITKPLSPEANSAALKLSPLHLVYHHFVFSLNDFHPSGEHDGTVLELDEALTYVWQSTAIPITKVWLTPRLYQSLCQAMIDTHSEVRLNFEFDVNRTAEGSFAVTASYRPPLTCRCATELLPLRVGPDVRPGTFILEGVSGDH